MDINSLIQALQNQAPQIAKNYCIVNGELMNLDDIQNMGYREFSLRSKINMPRKLYKYFPNKLTEIVNKNHSKKASNYSLQSLKDNTVFMQSPSLFDDIYDSDINLSYEEYEKIKLLEYGNRCELNVCETMSTQELGDALIQSIFHSFNNNGNFNSIFKRKPISEAEELSNKLFIQRLSTELLKDNDLSIALSHVIYLNFKDFSQHLQNTFRATCFSTTPYSQLMWGGPYADCHKGFCLEYTLLPDNPQYENIYYNLFPMIYCKVRPNMTIRLAKFENKKITIDNLWDIYFHGALRKSIDWAFQNEWRLLLPLKQNQEIKDYCIRFFPITRVFLGNRMSQFARKEIIEICNEKGIPYVGVVRNPNVFEMQECAIKCEECPNYIGSKD